MATMTMCPRSPCSVSKSWHTSMLFHVAIDSCHGLLTFIVFTMPTSIDCFGFALAVDTETNSPTDIPSVGLQFLATNLRASHHLVVSLVWWWLLRQQHTLIKRNPRAWPSSISSYNTLSFSVAEHTFFFMPFFHIYFYKHALTHTLM